VEEVSALCDIAKMMDCKEECMKGCDVCGAVCDDDREHIVKMFVLLVLFNVLTFWCICFSFSFFFDVFLFCSELPQERLSASSLTASLTSNTYNMCL